MEFKEFEKIKNIKEYYGLKSINLRYIEDKIIIDSFGDKISIVLDDRFNIIDINSSLIVDENYIKNIDFSKLSYPFDKYTVSDIINLSYDVDVSDNMKNNMPEISDRILTYIKFLSMLIERYYSMSFHLQSLGYEMPSIRDYVCSIIDRIGGVTISDLRLHKKPSSLEVMNSIGLREDHILFSNYVKHIIDLYIENMGLKETSSSDELEYKSNLERVDVGKATSTLLSFYKDFNKVKEEGKIYR